MEEGGTSTENENALSEAKNLQFGGSWSWWLDGGYTGAARNRNWGSRTEILREGERWCLWCDGRRIFQDELFSREVDPGISDGSLLECWKIRKVYRIEHPDCSLFILVYTIIGYLLQDFLTHRMEVWPTLDQWYRWMGKPDHKQNFPFGRKIHLMKEATRGFFLLNS